MSNEVFEKQPDIIEEVIIDSDDEVINKKIEEPVKEEETPTPKKRGRGRPKGKAVTDEKHLTKLKKNLVEGRKTSIEARKRTALLKKIDDEAVQTAKRILENKKIEVYFQSKKMTPIIEEPPIPIPIPKRTNNMFNPVKYLSS